MAERVTEKEQPKKFYVDKLFVGGLSYKTTDESLRNYFSQFGPIKQAVVMKDTEKNVSRGFGFCIFKNPDDAVTAMDVKEHIIDDRKVDVRWALPKEMAPPPIVNEQQGKQMYKKLFVGGINHNTTINDFIDYFSKFGPIENCNIVMDQETKKNRGFGFVIFSNPETANAVLQQSYHIINGKRVEVKRAMTQKDQDPAVSASPKDHNAMFMKPPPYHPLNDYHYPQDPYYAYAQDPYYNDYPSYNLPSMRYHPMGPGLANRPQFSPIPVPVNQMVDSLPDYYSSSSNAPSSLNTSRSNIPNPLDSPGVLPHTMSTPVLPSLNSTTPNISLLETSTNDSPSLSYQRDSFSMVQPSASLHYNPPLDQSMEESFTLHSPNDSFYNTRCASSSFSQLSPPSSTTYPNHQDPYFYPHPPLDTPYFAEPFTSEPRQPFLNSASSDPLFPAEKTSSPNLTFEPSSPHYRQRQTEPILLSSPLPSATPSLPYESTARLSSPLTTNNVTYNSYNPSSGLPYGSTHHYDSPSVDTLFMNSKDMNYEAPRHPSPLKVKSYPKSVFQSDPGQMSPFAMDSPLYNNCMPNPLAEGSLPLDTDHGLEDYPNRGSNLCTILSDHNSTFLDDYNSKSMYPSSSTFSVPLRPLPEVVKSGHYDVSDLSENQELEEDEGESVDEPFATPTKTSKSTPKHYNHSLFTSQSGGLPFDPAMFD